MRTVEDFGAIGDGISSDKQAFIDMATNNNGIIRILEKSYNVNGLTLIGEVIDIVGTKKPVHNVNNTALRCGSILIGNVNIRASITTLENFGVDTGINTGLTTADGLVVNSLVNQNGIMLKANNISILGNNENNPTHSLLAQGFNRNEISNIDCSLNQFGVVCKGRSGFIKNIRGYKLKTSTVYAKSDIPSYGGDVLSAIAGNLIIDGVISETSTTNTECNAVYVHASTLSISTILVSNVQSKYGNSGLRVAGGGTSSLNASQIQFSNIQNESGNMAVELFGHNYETIGSIMCAINPRQGKIIQTSGSSYNYNLSNMTLLISDPNILSIDAALFAGTGIWNNISVRNPFRGMKINTNGTTKSGIFSGDVSMY